MPKPRGLPQGHARDEIAEKFGRPLFTFVDTPAPIPAWERKSADRQKPCPQPARDWRACRFPSSTTITGEGGSGGALAIAIADRVLDDGKLDLFGNLTGRLRLHHVARSHQKSPGRRSHAHHPEDLKELAALTASSSEPRAAPTLTTKPPPRCLMALCRDISAR